VVRHHELGWRANAMCVWDVPEDRVDGLGQALSGQDGVNLCYRRRRAEDWPYNLYCMIHGHDRAEVHTRLRDIRQRCGLQAFPHQLLFSTRRFKQCGARYAVAADA
ncbi:MAG: Lrp/AsnC family transcriptional regulator, partial [Rhodocyclaceae bacterium]|nr:Lrp/AsnC family transcriptional regulator [Rhodocyclaceae bacterium]